MKAKLGKFINYWDEAALTTLGSEFHITDLLSAQSIINIDGSSILDYICFDSGLEVEIPTTLAQTVTYFKAPWDD